MVTRRKISRLKRKRFDLRALTAITIISFLFGMYAGVTLSHVFGFRGRIWLTENVQEATVKIAAVRSDGVGMILDLKVEISPGTGQVLVNTAPLVGFDFQYADRTAVKVASKFTGYALDEDGEGLKGADITFTVSTQTGKTVEIDAIDGPSAGAAATIAVIAAIQNRAVKSDVVITGAINLDGSLGEVGGIGPKAKAAEDAKMRLFLVPEGQRVDVYERFGMLILKRKEPLSVLMDYARQENWGLQILEVSTIADAVDYFLI